MQVAKLQLSGLAMLVLGRVISWVTGFVALYCKTTWERKFVGKGNPNVNSWVKAIRAVHEH